MSGATAVEQSIYVYEAGQIVAQFDKTGTGDLAATDIRTAISGTRRRRTNSSPTNRSTGTAAGDFVTDDLLWALTDQLNSVRDLAAYDAVRMRPRRHSSHLRRLRQQDFFDWCGRASSVIRLNCSMRLLGCRTTGTAGMTPRSAVARRGQGDQRSQPLPLRRQRPIDEPPPAGLSSGWELIPRFVLKVSGIGFSVFHPSWAMSGNATIHARLWKDFLKLARLRCCRQLVEVAHLMATLRLRLNMVEVRDLNRKQEGPRS